VVDIAIIAAMLYTGKGDDGSTGTFSTGERVSKSSLVPECLGTLDELNSFLGFCKVKAEESELEAGEEKSYMCCILHEVQQNLFIVQSEVAGSDKHIEEWKVQRLEMFVNEIEKELPVITSFTISGGTELSALLDVARTIARRAERKIVEVHENNSPEIYEYTRSYMNRLSSLLFALSRLVNKKARVEEDHPDYQ
jgi:cob(I)alamin adenosyltransferase